MITKAEVALAPVRVSDRFFIGGVSMVGFGDITPKTEPARIVAMVQMLTNLVVLAVLVRLIFGAATRGVARLQRSDD